MNVFLDTNILLNDFFHRNPDFGFQRISGEDQAREVSKYRELVSEALLFLSLQKDVQAFCSSSIISRFAAVLGDLLVPPDLVLEEIRHWLSNLKLLDITSNDLQIALDKMESSTTKLDFDDYLLKHIFIENQIDLLVTSIPKSREFFWPILVFKPEKIRELTFN
jgi:hypothetical protein